MARRPKKSALMLAVTIVTLSLASLVNRCSGASSSSGELDDLNADESRNYRELLNIPKFGDRLAPRNRPHVEDGGTGAIASVVGPSVANAGGSKFRRQPGPGNAYPGVTYRNAGRFGAGVASVVPGDSVSENHEELHTLVNNEHDIKRSDVLVTGVVQNLEDTNTGSEYYAGADEDDEEQNEPDHEDDEEHDGGDDEADEEEFEEVEEPDHFDVQGRSAINGGLEDQHILLESANIRDNSLAQLVGQLNVSGSSAGANASSAQAHRLEMSTEFFVVPSTASTAASRSTTVRPGGVILAARNPPGHHNSNSNTHKLNVTPPTIIAASYPSGLRKEPWVVPVLVLACLSMIMMAAFEIFVLCKAWRTSPSRRHLFLGQMLLLGLFSCSGLAAVLTINPTILSCATMRFGAGVAFALVFASLLVKCVFLISLNGGVYLPAPYQGLLLLFAVLIQVAVGAQWLLTSPPSVDQVPISGGTAVSSRYHLLLTAGDLTHVNPTIPLCHTTFSELLFSLIYVVFLIIFVAILAIKSRGIRDNYREATYIGLAVGGIIPIWLGWTLCGLAVADRHRDACLAFGLVATASTVFLVMFMPKGRQLAAMGKEGLYVEDREERFSSLSRAGSGYSPSFFHFKPIKYGVMGASPTLQTNNGTVVGTTTTSKHQAVATLGGDRVALVTAAPPSYTPRMYHYFPAHMTHPFCYYPPQQARYPGLFMRPDEANLYTTLEQTMSSNPNVYFQRGGGVHPGMMY
ncbi:uncharacterized protein LOC5566873 isoform X1 [Aedes aegypti]|uniref:G-protein coupled receptors family 3 profile domain-containing protein n=1 Tax=Aedes aegypti TaxID=7159 RepID=A0A6I8T3N3_AEDAE|nr:uncharacterized protein LOC5566873 isoform X1 [Aedes aegypti]